MASKKQAAGTGGAVPAQEHKNGGDPMATFPLRPRRRAVVDGGSPQQQQVVAAIANSPLVPQEAATSWRPPLADVSNLIINDHAAPANRLDVVSSKGNGKTVMLKEYKVKPQAIVINPDNDKDKKTKLSGGPSVCRRVPTLSDELTKCSRESDGVVSNLKKTDTYDIDTPDSCNELAVVEYVEDSNGVVSNLKKTDPNDIDTPDSCNELAVVEYVEDINTFYKSTDGTCLPLSRYMSSQADINERMRALVINWIIEVQYMLSLMPETLYLTVYIIDRYLSMESVPKKELQLIGISAMLIASKYEDRSAPLIEDLLWLCENYTFTRDHVLTKEMAILDRLHWNLTVPTMYKFIVRYLKAAMGDEKLENMAFFYSELALVQYTMLVYPPSVTAAAAVYAARCTLGMNPLWTGTLEHHTGLTEPQLLDCTRRLMSFHALAPESKEKVVYNKYSKPKFGAVALQSPDKKLLAV